MFRHRFLASRLSGTASRNKIRLLLGARQTGKTSLLRNLLPDDATVYVDLQNSDLRRRYEADPSVFRREVAALPRATRNVVVDEIQKVPALLDEVQALYDAAPSRRQFFLTGSSARRLRMGSANLLPGRAHVFLLAPVCGWETGAAEHAVAPPALGRSAARVSKHEPPPFPGHDLSRRLRFGGLPGVWQETPRTAEATLSAYVGLYLEEEIRREAVVREMGPFVTFLRLAAAESGAQLNLAKLSNESGIAASTLKSYYQVLVDTFVGHWIPPYSRNARRRLLTTPRFVLFDVGVRNAAAEVPADSRLLSTEGGRLLEQWVAQELLARASYLGRGHRVSFWRLASGAEVDFIWEAPREDVPIEVKWTERPRPEDARHVERFLDEHPSRARRGLVVCRCPEPQRLSARVTAIPWRHL
jgi:predicted AAA+ superfamily ATPase